MWRFCSKIQDGRIIVAMGWQGHVTYLVVSDFFFSFRCHGNQDGCQHSKNNIFVQLVQNCQIIIVIGAQDHVTLFEVSDWFFLFCCHGNQDGSQHSKNNIFCPTSSKLLNHTSDGCTRSCDLV